MNTARAPKMGGVEWVSLGPVAEITLALWQKSAKKLIEILSSSLDFGRSTFYFGELAGRRIHDYHVFSCLNFSEIKTAIFCSDRLD